MTNSTARSGSGLQGGDRPVTIDLNRPDPRPALNAFLWNMRAIREVGLMPSTEHGLIEQMVRGEVRVAYYTSMGGATLAIVATDNPEAFINEDFETAAFALTRLQRRYRKRSSHREMIADDIDTKDAS